MSARHDHNLALLRRYLEAYEQGDPAILDEVLAPGYYQMNAGTREDAAATKQNVAQLGGKHASLTFEIDEVDVQDDKIHSRVTFHYTDVATGRQSTYKSLLWSVVADGKLSHGWGMHETISRWQQEGILPTGEAFRDWMRERRALAAGDGTATEAQHA